MLAEFIYVDVEVAGRGEIQLQRIEHRIGSKRLEYPHVLHTSVKVRYLRVVTREHYNHNAV